jgi:hypothetical protein
MIPHDFQERLRALSPEDLSRVNRAILFPLNEALRLFAEGKISERDCIAVGLAVNDTLRDFPHSYGSAYAIAAEKALRERLAELDADVQ